MSTHNLFTDLLDILNVKHTGYFANKLYENHPNKNDLSGLSKLLSIYKIENASIKVNDKENDIHEIELPFIAFLENDFVIVIKINKSHVIYILNGVKKIVSKNNFINKWSGVCMLIETNESSIEPNYSVHKKARIRWDFQKYIFFTALIGLMSWRFFSTEINKNLWSIIILLLYMAGGYFSFLIIQKQLNIKNGTTDKFCSLFKQSNCNLILNSSASKLWGIWSLGEISLAYFLSNIILILFDQKTLTNLAFISLCTIPLIIWSVWYQKTRAKEWCPLCLSVLSVLFFILSFYWVGIFYSNPIDFTLFFPIFALYVLSFSILNYLFEHKAKLDQLQKTTRVLNKIKQSKNTFISLSKEQPYFEIDQTTSKILFGNFSASTLITVVINPHCIPCKKTQKQIDLLLDSKRKDICIQYIFTSFNKELEHSALSLISIYFNSDTPKEIYTEWFSNGGNSNAFFFEKYPYSLDSRVYKEYEIHQNWCKGNNVKETPVILFNGYKIPDFYTINDLEHIL